MAWNPWRPESSWSSHQQLIELKELLAARQLVHELPTALEMIRLSDAIWHSWWLGCLAILTASLWSVCAMLILADVEYRAVIALSAAAIGPIGWVLCLLWRRRALDKLWQLVRAKPELYEALAGRWV